MKRCGEASSVYLTAVLEYVTSEIMELSGNVCRENKRKRVTPEDISMAIRGDPELAKLCAGMSLFIGDKLHITSSMLKSAPPKSKKPEEEGGKK
jgi:histone H2A